MNPGSAAHSTRIKDVENILAPIRSKMEKVILSISPKNLSHQLSIGCSCCQGSLGTGAASQSHQFLRILSPVCAS